MRRSIDDDFHLELVELSEEGELGRLARLISHSVIQGVTGPCSAADEYPSPVKILVVEMWIGGDCGLDRINH